MKRSRGLHVYVGADIHYPRTLNPKSGYSSIHGIHRNFDVLLTAYLRTPSLANPEPQIHNFTGTHFCCCCSDYRYYYDTAPLINHCTARMFILRLISISICQFTSSCSGSTAPLAVGSTIAETLALMLSSRGALGFRVSHRNV